MALKLKGPSAGSIIMILVVAIALLFLWGKFTSKGLCTAADVTSELHGCAAAGDSYTIFATPEQATLESSTMWVIKIALLGLAVFIGWIVVSKFTGGHFARKDFVTLALLAVAVWFMWDKILVPSGLLSADSFADITWKTAQKMGLAP
jgi:hypothetical protein